MKRKAFAVFIFSGSIFASIIFNRGHQEKMNKRYNPVDPKSSLYQGFETKDADNDGEPDIIALLKSGVVAENPRVSLIAKGPVSKLLYSANADFSGAEWQSYDGETVIVIPPPNGEKKIYCRFGYLNNVEGKKVYTLSVRLQ